MRVNPGFGKASCHRFRAQSRRHRVLRPPRTAGAHIELGVSQDAVRLSHDGHLPHQPPAADMHAAGRETTLNRNEVYHLDRRRAIKNKIADTAGPAVVLPTAVVALMAGADVNA